MMVIEIRYYEVKESKQLAYMSSKCESMDFSIVWVVEDFDTNPVRGRSEL